MKLSHALAAACAAACGLIAVSAHALTVHFDPPASFNFYVNEPSYGYSDGLGGPAEIYPEAGSGYVVDGVSFVEFGLNGETMTFGAGTPGQYELVAPEKLWTVTELYKIQPLNAYLDEVVFDTDKLSSPQTLVFTNPAGGTVDVTIDVTNGVPEPASWALMLIGIGAMGVAIRRRRSVSAAA